MLLEQITFLCPPHVHMHDDFGHKYNISRVMSADGMTLDDEAYKGYSRVQLGPYMICSYYSMVGSFITSLVYVTLRFS